MRFALNGGFLPIKCKDIDIYKSRGYSTINDVLNKKRIPIFAQDDHEDTRINIVDKKPIELNKKNITYNKY